MKDIVNELTEKFRQQHSRARRYTAMLLVLALVTTLFVNWQLHGVGISMTADYQCGFEEHEHTADCYEKVLICGYEEGEPEDPTAAVLPDDAALDTAFGVDPEPEVQDEPQVQSVLVPHEHTEACYEERQVLTCSEEEHEHTDDCFDPEDGSLICDIFPHTHDDSCYTTEYELVCGKEEGELEEAEPEQSIAAFEAAVTLPMPELSRPVVIDQPEESVPVHHHTEDCYREELVCTIPEHHHTVECLSDPLADVETEADWLAKTDTTLSGSWGKDLLTVASSQLGYEESTKNFRLDVEDEETVRGWSRYGAWYGNPYGEWDVMFLSYCLHYADVPQSVVPQRAGVLALRSDLRGSDWLLDGSAAPQAGDIVIYDAASGAETVGIVEEVDDVTGNVTVISGDVEGAVAQVTVSAGSVTNVISVTGAAAAAEDSGDDSEGPVFGAADGAFSISVAWTGKDAPAVAALAAEDASTGEIRLDKHIKNVTLAKEVDGVETPIESGSEVRDGEKVFVEVNFNFAAGELTAANNKVLYQLPGGLTLTEKVDKGIIYNQSSQQVGTYTIDENGLVTMTFDSTFGDFGKALDGRLKFEATADRSKTEDGKVTIGDATLVIKQNPDLTVTKALINNDTGKKLWSDADGNYYAYWQVEVTSQKGSGGPVTIEDVLKADALPASHAPENLITLIKYDAEGQSTEISTTEYPYEITEDGRVLTFKNLPELQPEERYVLKYATMVTAQTVKDLYGNSNPNILYNQASASAEDVKAVTTDWQKITFDRNVISKKGVPNGNGLIDWTITINAPQKVPGGLLKDYTLWDAWPTKDGADLVDLRGDIHVEITGETTTTTTITKDQLMKGIKIGELDPTGTAYKIVVTYQTTVPAAGGEVTNVAHIKEDDNHDYKSTAKVDVTVGVWELTKTHTGDRDGKALWSIDASNPTGAASFELKDQIQPTITEDGTTRTDVHYAYAAELQQAIEENLQVYLTGNSTPLNYAQAKAYLEEIYYYDANNKEVLSNDSTTPVLSFGIKVDTGKDATVSRIVLANIPTHEDRSQMTGAWTFANKTELWQSNRWMGEDTAEDTGYGEESILKEVSTDGQFYNSQNGSIGYDELDENHSLYYKITLIATADAKGQLSFTDTLPAGVTCPVNGNDMILKVDGVQRQWIGGKWTLNNHVASGWFSVTVQDLTPDKQYKIEFTYHVTLNEDAWKDKLTTEMKYTNTVTTPDKPDDKKASITTTVTRALNPLIKTGEQLMDANNAWTNKIKYTVRINPDREELGDGQWLTLRDTVTVPEGVSVYGDLSSVRLYYADTMTEVDQNLYYKLELDPGDTCWLKLKVPDRTALVLEYICTIDRGNVVSPTISNKIETEGHTSDTEEKQFQTNSSEATITRGQLVINKLDSASHQLLPDALFDVQKYDAEKNAFVPFTSGKTEANGQLVFDITTGSDDTLSPNVLYRIVETAAPANYILDSTPRYVLFYAKDSSKAEAFKAATGTDASEITVAVGDKTETINRDTNVSAGSAVGTTALDVENTYNRLTVYKYWFDESTNQPLAAADVPVPSIQVQLYRYAEGQKPEQAQAYGDVVTLQPDEQGSWSHTWVGEQIPAQENGVNYYYLVKELTEGNWVTTDANNEGVQTGTVVLRNTVYASYELPSTGGMGTAPFALAGGLTAAAAAVLLYRRRKQDERTEGEE